jgi:glycosyltransferase involved in cell wall biosynthesis
MNISIIIPLFNKKKYIKELVIELLNQISSEDEIIVVDDFSSDDGYTEVSILTDNRIKLERLDKNYGPSYARNYGAMLSTKEYILFFDADDIPHYNLILSLKDTIENNQNIKIFGYGILIQARNLKLKNTKFSSIEYDIHQEHEYAKRALIGQIYLTASSTCINRNFFLLSGGFNIRLRYCEDSEYWARVSSETKIIMIKNILACYRDVSGSLSYKKRVELGSINGYLNTIHNLRLKNNGIYKKLFINVLIKHLLFAKTSGYSLIEQLNYLKYINKKYRNTEAILFFIVFIPKFIVNILMKYRHTLRVIIYK